MNTSRMTIQTDDITTLAVDAIVNAANQRMLGGGGVDGAIHRAAGPRLLQACRQVPEVRPGVRCPTGQSRITPGFDLPAQYVIHTVGPVYSGKPRDAELLGSCYTESLKLSEQNDVQSIAFPCISTGVYHYPIDEAAQVAVQAVSDWLSEHDLPRQVIFCCFSDSDAAVYEGLLGE